MGLRRPKAVIERREEIGAVLSGDDSARSPVGRVEAALDQSGRFEIIEEVCHDRSVHSEVLGEGELAINSALGGGGKDLVAPGATRKVGHSVVCGRGIRPKDDAQAPAEVACQRADAAGGAPDVTVTRDLIHHPIIAGKALPRRFSVARMICLTYS
jgi:hypothetical protein